MSSKQRINWPSDTTGATCFRCSEGRFVVGLDYQRCTNCKLVVSEAMLEEVIRALSDPEWDKAIIRNGDSAKSPRRGWVYLAVDDETDVLCFVHTCEEHGHAWDGDACGRCGLAWYLDDCECRPGEDGVCPRCGLRPLTGMRRDTICFELGGRRFRLETDPVKGVTVARDGEPVSPIRGKVALYDVTDWPALTLVDVVDAEWVMVHWLTPMRSSRLRLEGLAASYVEAKNR